MSHMTTSIIGNCWGQIWETGYSQKINLPFVMLKGIRFVDASAERGDERHTHTWRVHATRQHIVLARARVYTRVHPRGAPVRLQALALTCPQVKRLPPLQKGRLRLRENQTPPKSGLTKGKKLGVVKVLVKRLGAG